MHEEEKYTVRELAVKLKVDRRTVNNWINVGIRDVLLRADWIGGKRYVLWDDYRAWQKSIDLRRRGGKVVPEIEVEV